MIEVFANGLKFGYWTTARINRAVGNIAATFSLSLVAGGADDERLRLFPGDFVAIDVNGITAIRGIVDKILSSFSAGSHTVTVSGYEVTCDMVDCCLESPLEWTNATMDRIISDICGRFGVGFYNPMGVDVGEPLKKFAVDPGTKAVDAIAKLCKERGILPCSNGLGKVYLLKPSDAERTTALEEGVNLVSASAEVSQSGLYSDYFVYGSGKAKAKVQAHKTDGDVVRHRPLIIVDANATDKATVDARADWECSSRKAKSMSFRCAVHGWQNEDGGLWQPGTISSVNAPSLWLDDSVDLMISQVEFSWGNGGEQTSLTLVPADAFEPQPEAKKTKKTKAPRTDVWKTIKKAVGK